jgi:hypothetical protein
MAWNLRYKRLAWSAMLDPAEEGESHEDRDTLIDIINFMGRIVVGPGLQKSFIDACLLAVSILKSHHTHQVSIRLSDYSPATRKQRITDGRTLRSFMTVE